MLWQKSNRKLHYTGFLQKGTLLVAGAGVLELDITYTLEMAGF